jgi:peptidyl-prolyl cis-trans isomerase C
VIAGSVLAAVAATGCSRKAKSAANSGAPPAIDRVTPLPSPLPAVAARVNGQLISTSNVRIFAMRAGAVPDDKAPGAYREAVQHLIVRELLFQEANRRGLKADDRLVEQKYDEAHLPYKDDKSWAEFLRKQGMDPPAFRAELRVQYTVQALLKQQSEQTATEITDAEAEQFFNQNPDKFETGERLRARHILIRVPPDVAPGRRDEFRTKAEGLLARIRSGEDFAKLAGEYSDDVGSKGKGGVLQVFSKGQMHPSFEKVAYELKPGQLSDVVETPFGFHIIRLDERLPSEKLPFEAVKAEVKQYLQAQRQQASMQAFVNDLRAKARIETYL